MGRKAWWLFPPGVMSDVRRRWDESLATRRQTGEDVRDAGELPFDVRTEQDIAELGIRIIQEVRGISLYRADSSACPGSGCDPS